MIENNLNVWKSPLERIFPGELIKHLEKNESVNEAFSPLGWRIDSSQRDSLDAWILLYFKIHVMGAPIKTQQAKQRDLEKFMRFFNAAIGKDCVDGWTPAVTRCFQNSLANTVSVITSKTYSPTTINRVMATLRHFARWLQSQRPLLTGDPFYGVKERQTDEPTWSGLTTKQVLSLKEICQKRIQECGRANQNPLLEAVVFYVLLQTGLRESELVALNVGQYHHEGLHQVLRHKNKRISLKVPVPKEAREFLEKYLATRKEADLEEPLFLSRYQNRLAAQDVRRICLRLLKHLPPYEREDFKLTPHMLRHTFLKQVADRHGVHFAQQMSGNISIREIFRYAKPSQAEIDIAVERLF